MILRVGARGTMIPLYFNIAANINPVSIIQKEFVRYIFIFKKTRVGEIILFYLHTVSF